jgi:hypothetical protein
MTPEDKAENNLGAKGKGNNDWDDIDHPSVEHASKAQLMMPELLGFSDGHRGGYLGTNIFDYILKKVLEESKCLANYTS